MLARLFRRSRDTPSAQENTFDTNRQSASYPLVEYNGEFYEGYYNAVSKRPKPSMTLVNKTFIKRVKTLIHNRPLLLGITTCILCGETIGCGDTQCVVRGGGSTFNFPDGVAHYYEAHNVLPSEEFYTFIMRICMK